MKEPVRLVGVGQPAAGDDGVGIAVVREVARQPWAGKLEIHETCNPLRLIDWIGDRCRMILVDAVTGNGRCGSVARLSPQDLADPALHSLSSHGVNVSQVVELARTLDPRAVRAQISIIAVTILPPAGPSFRMSAEVAAAVPEAVAWIRRLVEH